MWTRFLEWYERHYVLNVSVALGLFILQIVHLSWLGGDVIVPRLGGAALFYLNDISRLLIIFVDYTEIPAIISMTLVYVHAWQRGHPMNAILMLTLLNSQWLHMFWITDEFVTAALSGASAYGTVLPQWLAWIAILIDYLEVPVIIDTAYKLSRALRNQQGLIEIHEVLRGKYK